MVGTAVLENLYLLAKFMAYLCIQPCNELGIVKPIYVYVSAKRRCII